MAARPPRSVKEIDLSPLPGKRYYNAAREWREEFIYFLMVDRFHDDLQRRAVTGPGRSTGAGSESQLGRFCGGTIRGITRHLDYIQGLGCTSLWLSPIMENDEAPDRDSTKYHGYAIRNYLAVDPRFGTLEDFQQLVEEAHRRDMRVFLDAVANHCGDVWSYPDDKLYYYSDDHRQFPLGAWRSPDHPVPVELRNPEFFHRRGQIREGHWDTLPETHWGDFCTLKGFNNDDDAAGLELQHVIIAAHRYWVRETDIDGFRMDAVKHMGEPAIARFCQNLREYAYTLGKRNFLLFGELVAGDDAINRYTGPNTAAALGDKTIFYGLSSVLDFPLYWVLPGVIKGHTPPTALFARHEALRDRALNRGELGRYLITFLDNHDQIGQNYKRRFAAGATDAQVIAGVGYLLCALGTPCIYYGTEQGFAGEGESDHFIRETMFNLDDAATDYLNRDCAIYQAIARIAAVNREQPALRFGRMYFRDTASDGTHFRQPVEHPCTLAFSRVLANREVLVAFNTSTDTARHDSVVVDAELHGAGTTLRYLYGASGEVEVQRHPVPEDQTRFVTLDLEPGQFVILG